MSKTHRSIIAAVLSIVLSLSLAFTGIVPYVHAAEENVVVDTGAKGAPSADSINKALSTFSKVVGDLSKDVSKEKFIHQVAMRFGGVTGAVSGGMAGGMVGSKAIKDKQYVPDQGATIRMNNLKADYKNNATTKPTNMATGGNTVSYDRNAHGNAYYKNYDDEGNRRRVPPPNESKPAPSNTPRRGNPASDILDEAHDDHKRIYNDALSSLDKQKGRNGKPDDNK